MPPKQAGFFPSAPYVFLPLCAPLLSQAPVPSLPPVPPAWFQSSLTGSLPPEPMPQPQLVEGSPHRELEAELITAVCQVHQWTETRKPEPSGPREIALQVTLERPIWGTPH